MDGDICPLVDVVELGVDSSGQLDLSELRRELADVKKDRQQLQNQIQ